MLSMTPPAVGPSIINPMDRSICQRVSSASAIVGKPSKQIKQSEIVVRNMGILLLSVYEATRRALTRRAEPIASTMRGRAPLSTREVQLTRPRGASYRGRP